MEISDSDTEIEENDEEMTSNEEMTSDEEMSENDSDLERPSDEEEEESQSSDDNTVNESNKDAEETTDTEDYTDEAINKKKKLKVKSTEKKSVNSSKKEKKLKLERTNSPDKNEYDDLESKILADEVQMANEISNRYATSNMSLIIPINADEQKKIFSTWICESVVKTKDIDFNEWQNNHSAREAYFFGPDNVIKYFKN